MARPAVETAVGGVDTAFGASHTISLDIGTVGNHLTVVVSIRQQGVAATITGVTWNGVAMTQQVFTNANQQNDSAVFTLSSPATGVNDLVITTSDSGRVCVGAYMCSGVDVGGTPEGNIAQTAGTATASTIDVSADADALVIGGVNHNDNSEAITAGAAQVNTIENNVSSCRHMSSSEDGVATTTHSYSWTDSNVYATSACEIQGTPTGAPAGWVGGHNLVGVGL